MRQRLRVVVIAFVLMGLTCAASLGSLMSSMPRAQGARVDAAPALGVTAGDAYIWILPSDSGVVVVDAGMDGSALLAELEARSLGIDAVRAVLVTHGHFDHIGGLQALPGVPVIAGPGEGPLIRGERYSEGAMPGLLESLMERPTPPETLREFTDGEVLTLDGLSITALHVPGHTPGSAMYLHGDLLFTGDSLCPVGGELTPISSLFADDIDLNHRSLERLRDVPFDRVADGHGGLTTDAKAALLRTLGDRP